MRARRTVSDTRVSQTCIRLVVVAAILASYTTSVLGAFEPAEEERQRVGPIVIGNTTVESSELLFGKGRPTIGYHSGSARCWQYGSASLFSVDSANATAEGLHPISSVTWRHTRGRQNPSLPRKYRRLDYCGLGLDTPLTKFKNVLGQSISRATAFDRDCLVWTITCTDRRDKLKITAAFDNGRAVLVNIEISRHNRSPAASNLLGQRRPKFTQLAPMA